MSSLASYRGMVSRFTAVLILLAASVSFGGLRQTRAQPTPSEKLGPDVRQALVANGEVRVVVALQEPRALQNDRTNLDAVQQSVGQLQQDVLSTLSASQFEAVHVYDAVPAFAGIIRSEAGLDRLVRHRHVLRVDPDVGGSGSLSTTTSIVRADDWHTQGVDGTGVVTAVLDSGIDTDHDDLASSLVHEACFLDSDGSIDGRGECPNGSDRQTGSGAAEDDHGHGTNVTGIVTSDGVQAAQGVAFNADVVALKVLDSGNSFYYFSEITAALDYLITNPGLGVQVINMSLGTNTLFSSTCDNTTSWNMAGASAVNTLRQNGVIAIASSMNNSSGSQMGSPACLSGVVSVGATDNADNVTSFSNSNALLDLVAPGVTVQSSGLSNGTSTYSGTSQAAPHAAGCAALYLDEGLATTPDEIETLLEDSPVAVTDPKNGLTFPRLDCYTNAIPVELSSFDAQVERDAVVLRWHTESETNNAGFEVQRRAAGGSASGSVETSHRGVSSGASWTTIATLDGAGTTSQPQSYRFTDAQLPYAADSLRYRLRQIDLDGTETFTNAITVAWQVTEAELLPTYPNPARSQATVRYAVPERKQVQIALYDMLGRRVRTVADGQVEGRTEQTIDVSDLASGTYFLRMQTDGHTNIQRLTVVQ